MYIPARAQSVSEIENSPIHTAPPRISLDPARQIVRPNDRVQIRCTATGAQPITITWSKEVGYMPPTVVLNGGELTVRD